MQTGSNLSSLLPAFHDLGTKVGREIGERSESQIWK